jgi:hypothetical protein
VAEHNSVNLLAWTPLRGRVRGWAWLYCAPQAGARARLCVWAASVRHQAPIHEATTTHVHRVSKQRDKHRIQTTAPCPGCRPSAPRRSAVRLWHATQRHARPPWQPPHAGVPQLGDGLRLGSALERRPRWVRRAAASVGRRLLPERHAACCAARRARRCLAGRRDAARHGGVCRRRGLGCVAAPAARHEPADPQRGTFESGSCNTRPGMQPCPGQAAEAISCGKRHALSLHLLGHLAIRAIPPPP